MIGMALNLPRKPGMPTPAPSPEITHIMNIINWIVLILVGILLAVKIL